MCVGGGVVSQWGMGASGLCTGFPSKSGRDWLAEVGDTGVAGGVNGGGCGQRPRPLIDRVSSD